MDSMVAQRRKQVAGVLREPDTPARHGERCGKDQLKAEEKAEKPAQAARINRTQKAIGSSSLRHRGTEFRPYQPVADRK